MKKLFIAFLALLFLVSCGKDEETKKENNSNDKKIVETIKEKGPVLQLRYKFKKGDKFSYKLQTKAVSSEEITADTTIANEITQNATYRFNFLVKSVDDNNTANIEVRISSITAETIFNGQSMKYDSKFIYSTRERAQFVDYESVKKVPFLISVNEIGQVINVENVNRIMRNILEIQKVPDTLSAKTKEQMRTNIANGTLMPLTQQIFKVVAEDEVGVDSTWQLKYNTPLGVFNVENTAVFRVTNLNFDKDTTAAITSNLFISVSGNNVVNEQGVRYTFSQPNLQAEGKLSYNYTRGLVEKSESNTSLEMAMFMEGVDANGNPLKSTKRDISNNTNIVTLL
jgi:hypothetical protein